MLKGTSWQRGTQKQSSRLLRSTNRKYNFANSVPKVDMQIEWMGLLFLNISTSLYVKNSQWNCVRIRNKNVTYDENSSWSDNSYQTHRLSSLKEFDEDIQKKLAQYCYYRWDPKKIENVRSADAKIVSKNPRNLLLRNESGQNILFFTAYVLDLVWFVLS